MKKQRRGSYYSDFYETVSNGLINQFRSLLGLRSSRTALNPQDWRENMLMWSFQRKNSLAVAVIYDCFGSEFASILSSEQLDLLLTPESAEILVDSTKFSRVKKHPCFSQTVTRSIVWGTCPEFKEAWLDFCIRFRGDNPFNLLGPVWGGRHYKMWNFWNPRHQKASELSMPFNQHIFTVLCCLKQFELPKDLRVLICQWAGVSWWEEFEKIK